MTALPTLTSLRFRVSQTTPPLTANVDFYMLRVRNMA